MKENLQNLNVKIWKRSSVETVEWEWKSEEADFEDEDEDEFVDALLWWCKCDGNRRQNVKKWNEESTFRGEYEYDNRILILIYTRFVNEKVRYESGCYAICKPGQWTLNMMPLDVNISNQLVMLILPNYPPACSSRPWCSCYCNSNIMFHHI